MTYKNSKKVIENQIKKKNAEAITAEEYEVFKSDMIGKLDVFLLNNRITKEQYTELVGIM
jgi:hypothetical protein